MGPVAHHCPPLTPGTLPTVGSRLAREPYPFLRPSCRGGASCFVCFSGLRENISPRCCSTVRGGVGFEERGRTGTSMQAGSRWGRCGACRPGAGSWAPTSSCGSCSCRALPASWRECLQGCGLRAWLRAWLRACPARGPRSSCDRDALHQALSQSLFVPGSRSGETFQSGSHRSSVRWAFIGGCLGLEVVCDHLSDENKRGLREKRL